jgi:psiF repeat-containing protein
LDRDIDASNVNREACMKKLALAALVGTILAGAYFVNSASAQAPAATCAAQAGEKKLAGAAKNSFMKKCQSDAAKSCGTQAAEKKLAGAAKTSFTKKCVTDATGA